MGCQYDIAAKILEKKADYIFSPKGNQSSMRGDALSLTMHGQKRAGNSAENFSKLVRFARNILKRCKQTIGTRDSYNLMMTRAALQQDFSVQVLRHVFS